MIHNDALETLYTRRSCRDYLPEQIGNEELGSILKAGTLAPTGHGSQSPTMVVVQDAETVALMSRLNREIMGVESDPFYGAPTVVVVFGDPEHPTWMEDGCLVMGNLLNAAAAVGIGACWIHRARQTFETPEGRALMKKWGLPERLVGIGNCVLGHAASEPRPRKPLKDNYIVRA